MNRIPEALAGPSDDLAGATACGRAPGSEGRRKGGRPLYWRSVEEFAETPEFRAIVEHEFPQAAMEIATPEDRRQFIKVMGASFALAGLALTGCRRWPEERIYPFAARPENRTPGETVSYATCMEIGGFAQGILATSYDGRPIKVDGNPEHPFNRGASDVFAQASILDLYDLDRSRAVHRGDEESSWEAFAAFAGPHFAELKRLQGEGLAFLVEATSSPTALRLRGELARVLPRSTWHEWEPISLDNERAGTALALGAAHRVQLRLHREDAGEPVRAKTIVALDGDFLGDHPAALRHTREYAALRRVHGNDPAGADPARLYSFDSGQALCGVMADHRAAVRAGDVAAIAALIARGVGLGDGALGPALARLADGASIDAPARRLAEQAARDLLAGRGASAVIVGRRQPAEVHALAVLVNAHLGNAGRTIEYLADGERPTRIEAIRSLVEAARAGRVSTLVIVGANPVYDAPADLDFAAALGEVSTVVHCGLWRDETARLAQWHLPRPHYLECWGDARSFDGTYTVAQPLILPMIAPQQGGRSAIELFADILAWCGSGEAAAPGESLVRQSVAAMIGGRVDDESFARRWRRLLHDGFLPGSAAGAVAGTVRADAVATALGGVALPASGSMEIVLRADPKVFDGRFANNAWLQELPEPVTKIAWDNAAVMSLATADALGVRRGDMVSISHGGRSLSAAALPMPAHPDNSITLALGYGRDGRAGRIADGAGFDAYRLRAAAAPDILAGATVSAAGGSYTLVSTQDRGAGNAVADAGVQERLPTLVREGSLETWRADPGFAKHPPGYHVAHRLSLWEETNLDGAKHRWAMTIDLSTCTGCNACVVACQAENNVPIVGKEQMRRGREMHWIRIDRYFRGDDPARPDAILFQPVTCMHCENAPCEQVCPVAATVHDEDGLNTMVYNRCVGTRYCSNNCPYKVRRFNYFDWHRMDHARENRWIQHQPDYYLREQSDEWKRMQFNPDVTVRMRGVMEKCTFCTQRIARAKIDAKNAWAQRGGRQGGENDYAIPDGTIVPACAQACPAQAIVFGDLNDKGSRIASLFKNKLAYEMLEELNVKPRVKYLARVTNPGAGSAVAAGGVS